MIHLIRINTYMIYVYPSYDAYTLTVCDSYSGFDSDVGFKVMYRSISGIGHFI